MAQPSAAVERLTLDEALKMSIDSLEQFFQENPDKKKDLGFWQNKATADIQTAATKWPRLYKFNTTEERIIYFYEKFSRHGSSPYVAYLQTLFAFDVYIPQNASYFGPEHATMWHFRRHLPYRGDAIYHYILLEEGVSTDLFVECYRYDPENNDNLLLQLLRECKPEQFAGVVAIIVDGMYENLNYNQPRPLANVLDQPETVKFIKSKLVEQVSSYITTQVEYSRHLAAHPEEVKPVWDEEKQDYIYPMFKMKMPTDKLCYSFFKFNSSLDGPLNSYALLWKLKNNKLGKKKKKIQVPDLIPIWEDSEGLEELAYHLVQKDDVSTFVRVLTGYRDPREAHESENSSVILCYEMLCHVLPDSALFNIVLQTLGDRPSRNFPGNFQILFSAYERKKTLFFIETESKMDDLMQAFYPDFKFFDGNDSEDEDEHSECSHSECNESEEEELVDTNR